MVNFVNSNFLGLWSFTLMFLLQQMSVKRHDLEKSSDKITSDLEILQQINEEQNKRISETLTELQQQQLANQRLLESDWMNTLANQERGDDSGRNYSYIYECAVVCLLSRNGLIVAGVAL